MLYEGIRESHRRIDRDDALRGYCLRRERNMAISFQPPYRGNCGGRDCAHWSCSIYNSPREKTSESVHHSQTPGRYQCKLNFIAD